MTIGKNGRVRADVFGNTVVVEGEVDGNLFAQQQAILRQSGAVRGNITAPRVMLEDGSRFRGSIDMESKDAAKPGPAAHGPQPATAHPPTPAAAPVSAGGNASGAAGAQPLHAAAAAPQASGRAPGS